MCSAAHLRSSSSAVLTRCWLYWTNSEKRKAKALSPTSLLPRSGRSSTERGAARRALLIVVAAHFAQT